MALFVLTVGLPACLFLTLLYRKKERPRKYSKAVLVLLLLSVIFNVALAQNYTQSVIPYPVNDGIGLSNGLAYLVIGEPPWSKDLFKNAYDISTMISIALLILYAFLLVIEKQKGG